MGGRISKQSSKTASRRSRQAAPINEQLVKILALVGPTPGSLGSLFGEVGFGSPLAAFDRSLDDTIGAFLAGCAAKVHLRTDGTHRPTGARLERVEIEAAGEFGELLLRELIERWGQGAGSSPVVDMERTHWVDPDARRRATLIRHTAANNNPVNLMLEPFELVAHWINPAPPSVVPVWLLGKPAETLIEWTGSYDKWPSCVSWSGPGLGVGVGPTSLWADIEQGTVVSLRACAGISSSTRGELVGHLTELHGNPSGGEGVLQWTRPAMTLADNIGTLQLIIRA
jgi:hypothetical protein